jgi:hypothetical protein
MTMLLLLLDYAVVNMNVRHGRLFLLFVVAAVVSILNF